jgi:hypothetical protein
MPDGRYFQDVVLKLVEANNEICHSQCEITVNIVREADCSSLCSQSFRFNQFA